MDSKNILANYTPDQYGVVIAIRISMADNGHTPIAELKLAFGETVVIRWDCVDHRERFLSGINAYTLYYDERPKRSFDQW